MKTRKFIRKMDDTVDFVIRMAFIFIALMGVYIVIDAADVYNSAGTSTIAKSKPEVITEETLKEISDDAVAWITLDGTSVDYPVMQGETNNEYLNKNCYGEYSLSGSIFLDVDCAPGFTDDYSLIYGHHMSGGYMFGALDAYGERDYFDSHLHGTLTAGDTEYDFTVLAFLICDAKNHEIFNACEDIPGREEFILKNAEHINPDAKQGRLVTLTTCKDPGMTNRTVLAGKITEKK